MPFADWYGRMLMSYMLLCVFFFVNDTATTEIYTLSLHDALPISLANGDYVVRSPNWSTSRGAVTWGNGTTGVTGVVSGTNSLVGSTVGDAVSGAGGGVTVLGNGNYVVRSPNWRNGAATNAGAVTWVSGSTTVTGAVSAANSLIGGLANDQIGGGGGGGGVTVLGNGNYLVRSPSLGKGGALTNVGAVTWGSGTNGVSGTVSETNSLVGSAANDQGGGGGGGVTVLGNDNYAVRAARSQKPTRWLAARQMT